MDISNQSRQLAFILTLSQFRESYPQTDYGFPESFLFTPEWKACDVGILWFPRLSLVLQRWFCSTFQSFYHLQSQGRKQYSLLPRGRGCCLPLGYLLDIDSALCSLEIAILYSYCACQLLGMVLCVCPSKSFICVLTFYSLTRFAQKHRGIEMDARRACWPLKRLASPSHGHVQLRGAAINECQASISFPWIPLVPLKAFRHSTWLAGRVTSVEWSAWQRAAHILLPNIRKEKALIFSPCLTASPLLEFGSWLRSKCSQAYFTSRCPDLLSKVLECLPRICVKCRISPCRDLASSVSNGITTHLTGILSTSAYS